MNGLEKFTGHLKTVVRHRHLVLVHCIKAGIPWQGLKHDLSKFSPTEFIPGVKYFQGFRSPNEGEREALGCSKAWMHHKGRNRHHFEYWLDINVATKKYCPVPMPTKYLIEMFCDRVAASKTYMKEKYTDASAFEYYDGRRDKRELHPETAAALEELLVMLKDKGEKETFAYIRTMKK